MFFEVGRFVLYFQSKADWLASPRLIICCFFSVARSIFKLQRSEQQEIKLVWPNALFDYIVIFNTTIQTYSAVCKLKSKPAECTNSPPLPMHYTCARTSKTLNFGLSIVSTSPKTGASRTGQFSDRTRGSMTHMAVRRPHTRIGDHTWQFSDRTRGSVTAHGSSVTAQGSSVTAHVYRISVNSEIPKSTIVYPNSM